MAAKGEKVEYAEIYHAEEGHAIGNVATTYHTNSPKVSLFASSPIQISDEYRHLIFKERSLFLINMFALVVLGPLVFRYALGSSQYVWAAGVTSTEWFILIVIFLDTLNSIFRGLPMVSGRPTETEATRSVSVHGSVVIGNCSPFVSEDDAIFLRALLGKTCTVFCTCAGRHSLQGLYVDTILNEKRLKGEENRKALWLAWMTFLSSMVQLCLKIKHREYTQTMDQAAPDHEGSGGAPDTAGADDKEEHRRSKDFGIGRYDDAEAAYPSSLRISKMEAFSTVGGEMKEGHFRNLSMLTQAAHRKQSLSGGEEEGRGRAATHHVAMYTSHSAPLTRLSEILSESSADTSTTKDHSSGKSLRPSSSMGEANGLSTHVESTPPDASGTASNPLLSSGNGHPPPNGDRSSALSQSARDEYLVDAADIIPLLSFLHHWLAVLKEREWTYDYRNTPSALDSIFLAAPFLEIFDAEDIVEVHSLMVALYDAFTGPPIPDPPDPQSPVNGDDMLEIRWVFKRSDLPDWNIHWQYYSRARLRPMEKGQFRDPAGAPAEFVTTRIKPGDC